MSNWRSPSTTLFFGSSSATLPAPSSLSLSLSLFAPFFFFFFSDVTLTLFFFRAFASSSSTSATSAAPPPTEDPFDGFLPFPAASSPPPFTRKLAALLMPSRLPPSSFSFSPPLSLSFPFFFSLLLFFPESLSFSMSPSFPPPLFGLAEIGKCFVEGGGAAAFPPRFPFTPC
jgi:hypothetical protein